MYKFSRGLAKFMYSGSTRSSFLTCLDKSLDSVDGRDWKDDAYEKGIGKRAFIKSKILEQKKRDDDDDCFMLFDLGDVYKKYRKWKVAMPRVTPFYAVKCNPDVTVLRLLAALNCGFDCASKGELLLLLETLKMAPSRIINANTWKQESHIKYARDLGVKMMTFDCEVELEKIARIHPDAELVLRLAIYDESAELPFGIKFGTTTENATFLMSKAQQLGVKIVGVSFHIGSGSRNPSVFDIAIKKSREVFDEGLKYGFKMNLLDIGGGFPGKKNMGPDDVTFEVFAEAVNTSLALHFPDEEAVDVISEPGRFFNESAGTLVVNVYGKRRKTHPGDKGTEDSMEGRKLHGFDYFVNNGIFASFGRNLVGYGDVLPQPVDEKKLSQRTYPTTVYGNTCAEMDYCNENCQLQELNIGDWIYYEDIGAYNSICGGTFNGYKPPARFNYAVPKRLLPFMDAVTEDEDYSRPKGAKSWKNHVQKMMAASATVKAFKMFSNPLAPIDDEEGDSLND